MSISPVLDTSTAALADMNPSLCSQIITPSFWFLCLNILIIFLLSLSIISTFLGSLLSLSDIFNAFLEGLISFSELHLLSLYFFNNFEILSIFKHACLKSCSPSISKVKLWSLIIEVLKPF